MPPINKRPRVDPAESYLQAIREYVTVNKPLNDLTTNLSRIKKPVLPSIVPNAISILKPTQAHDALFFPDNRPSVHESSDKSNELFTSFSKWCFGTEEHHTLLKIDVLLKMVELLGDDSKIAETPGNWYRSDAANTIEKKKQLQESMMSLLDTVNAGTNAIRHVALCVGVFSTMSYMLYNGVALLNLQSWADSVFTSSAGVTPLSSMNAANVMVLLLVEQQQVPLSVTDASLGTGESTEVVESTTRILLAQHALFTMDGFLNGFRQMETIFKCCSQPQHIPYQYTSAPLNPVAFPAEELLPRPLTSLQQQQQYPPSEDLAPTAPVLCLPTSLNVGDTFVDLPSLKEVIMAMYPRDILLMEKDYRKRGARKGMASRWLFYCKYEGTPHYRPDATSHRPSKKCGCTFQIAAKWPEDSDSVVLSKVDVQHTGHVVGDQALVPSADLLDIVTKQHVEERYNDIQTLLSHYVDQSRREWEAAADIRTNIFNNRIISSDARKMFTSYFYSIRREKVVPVKRRETTFRQIMTAMKTSVSSWLDAIPAETVCDDVKMFIAAIDEKYAVCSNQSAPTAVLGAGVASSSNASEYATTSSL